MISLLKAPDWRKYYTDTHTCIIYVCVFLFLAVETVRILEIPLSMISSPNFIMISTDRPGYSNGRIRANTSVIKAGCPLFPKPLCLLHLNSVFSVAWILTSAPPSMCVCACVCVSMCRMSVPETSTARAVCTPQGPVDCSSQAASLRGPLRTSNCVDLDIKCLALQGPEWKLIPWRDACF